MELSRDNLAVAQAKHHEQLHSTVGDMSSASEAWSAQLATQLAETKATTESSATDLKTSLAGHQDLVSAQGSAQSGLE